MSRVLTGSCLCGAVKIAIPDYFDFMGYCHCTECKKISGSDYAIVGGIAADKMTITQGNDAIHYYHKSDETDAASCRHCGASLFNYKLKQNRFNIRLGMLDDVPTQRPMFHIFIGSKSPWVEINDGLPQFEGLPIQSDK